MINHLLRLSQHKRTFCSAMKLLNNNLLSMASNAAAKPLKQTEQHTKQTTTTTYAANMEWKIIYMLPLVRWAAALSRLKVYQAALTTLGTTGAYALEQTGQVLPSTTSAVAAIGISGLMTITLSSLVVRHLVGIVYVNKTEDIVKLAFIDFWGNRRHVMLAVADLVPQWEQKKTFHFNFYQSVCLRGNPDYEFKLLPRYGIILDPYAFEQIFGD